MCTAITYRTDCHYFGRTLDLEYSYHESVTIMPRNYPLRFRNLPPMPTHHAIIGMAFVEEDYPLYYDATNEKGLSMAGLNFPHEARYFPVTAGRDNVASFEFIPWILGQCGTLQEARALLERVNLTDLPFRPELPATTLHWIIADRTGAITVESVADGLKVYDNPIGVMTNSPGFDYQMLHLSDYANLTAQPAVNRFTTRTSLDFYSRWMGAMGLPGDFSSASRFVRAAFVQQNAVSEPDEASSVSEFFHLLGCVSIPRGSVVVDDGRLVTTRYTSCCNTDQGIYYYTTYDNCQITAVDMHRENLDAQQLISFPLLTELRIFRQNGE